MWRGECVQGVCGRVSVWRGMWRGECVEGVCGGVSVWSMCVEGYMSGAMWNGEVG